MSFSAVRFIVLVFMAGEVGRAIHADIPLWHFAFAMPAAVLATAAGITPAALGIWEFTYAGALSLLGTPLGVTTAVALANRVLCSVASILLGLFLLPCFVFSRARHPVCTHGRACGATDETVSHRATEHTIERVGYRQSASAGGVSHAAGNGPDSYQGTTSGVATPV